MAECQRRGRERDRTEKGQVDATKARNRRGETRTAKFKVNTFIHFINYNIIHTYIHTYQAVCNFRLYLTIVTVCKLNII